MFWASADGRFEAYDARTGARVWAFRTTPAGARVRPGSAATYDIDGTQFIAVPMGGELWAFALDGVVPERGEPGSEPSADVEPRFAPAPRDTDTIETATLVENPGWAIGGKRNAIDEHTFNPVHAGVSVGARVQFLNNGDVSHTIAARDRSWNIGTLEPATWAH